MYLQRTIIADIAIQLFVMCHVCLNRFHGQTVELIIQGHLSEDTSLRTPSSPRRPATMVKKRVIKNILVAVLSLCLFPPIYFSSLHFTYYKSVSHLPYQSILA